MTTKRGKEKKKKKVKEVPDWRRLVIDFFHPSCLMSGKDENFFGFPAMRDAVNLQTEHAEGGG